MNADAHTAHTSPQPAPELTTRPSGLTLVCERMPGVRSCALTFMIPAGYATEPHNEQGLNAMWSELLLRGAGGPSSRELADAFDRLGASRSVSSGPLFTRVSATMLGDALPDVLPLIFSVLREPQMREPDVDAARSLALQAIESLKDDPQERCSLAARRRHRPDPINRSGMGEPEHLAGMTRDALLGRWRERCKPGGAILGVAGDVDPARVAELVDQLSEGWTGASNTPDHQLVGERGYAHEQDDSKQVQIIIVHDAPSEASDDAPAERLASAVLSGGMSGRLFSEVREKRALCYAVSASYTASRDHGAVSAYVGTTPERAQESLDVLAGELSRLGKPGGEVSRDEFERARIGLRSRIVFAGESTSARAGSLALDAYRLGRPRTLEELTQRVEGVTLDELNARLAQRSLGEVTIQTLGPDALTPPGI